MSATRRLAAILAADVVGYSRLLEQDEAGTLAALKERRRSILNPLVAEHHGHIVKVMGDGVLVEFGSAVNAVACAVELQKRMATANDGLAEGQHIDLRIGINLGDVIVEGGDLYGDGVIIAVRLQGMAEPGGVCVSRGVHEQVGNKLSLEFEDPKQLIEDREFARSLDSPSAAAQASGLLMKLHGLGSEKLKVETQSVVDYLADMSRADIPAEAIEASEEGDSVH